MIIPHDAYEDEVAAYDDGELNEAIYDAEAEKADIESDGDTYVDDYESLKIRLKILKAEKDRREVPAV